MTQNRHANILRRLKKPEKNYIVVDFEWNQALRRNSPVFNRLPIHLGGEIIEIGAVKLRGDYSPGNEFGMDVRPVYFKQMHFKVKKITGIDQTRLSHARFFPQALEKFREWCGDDPVFITWGCDDKSIFEQNVIIHDLEYDWISEWINLQLIYNVQTDGNKNQKSLETAMEHFGIEQTRSAHDALGDAYNTALVAYRLNMDEGLKNYSKAPAILASRMQPAPKVTESEDNTPEALVHDQYDGFESKAAAFADKRIAVFVCPKCGKECTSSRWINQGDGRYMNIFTCPDGCKYLMRIRFRKNDDNTVMTNRLVYKADEDMLSFYKNKSAQARHRGRKVRTRKR